MVGAGTVHSLLWTYLRLRNSCKKAYMNITSDCDCDGDLTVSLKMVLAGQADQAPRRGGRQSSRQERGPGTQVAPPAPPTPPAPAPPAPAAAAPAPAPGPAPAPARRARRRGPGALFRDERRRLAQIEPGLLIPDSPLPIPAGPLEGATSAPPPPPPPALALLLAPSERAPGILT